jgi:hypothetical protein
VVKKGDIKGLHQAINLVLKKNKSFYSKVCRERAEHHFNYKDRFGEYISLFLNLIEKL